MSSETTEKQAGFNPEISRNILAVLKTHKKAFWAVAFFSGVVNLLMLTGSIYMLQIYDRVLASGSIPTLVALSLLVVGLYCFQAILDAIRSRILSRIGDHLSETLRPETFRLWIQQQLLGKMGKKLAPLQDLTQIQRFFSGPSVLPFFDLPWMPVYLFLLYIFHPLTGLVATVGALISVVLAVINNWRSHKKFAEASQLSMIAMDQARQYGQNAEVIQALGNEKVLYQKWAEISQKADVTQQQAADTSGFFSTLIKTFRMILQSAILGVGAYLAIKQEITPGTMIAGSILMGRALAPLDQAVGQWRNWLGVRRSYQRLQKSLSSLKDLPKTVELPAPRGNLLVQIQTATAPAERAPILEGVNFALKPGQGLGVIGPSGAGKTALARLLVGVWHPVKGEVRLDGATLSQWDPQQLGAHIGYLPQGVELFSGTVAENISRFLPDVPDEDVIEAAQLAGVHDLILKLPNGYQTEIGENGCVLSGGQKQRIALARALFRKPALIVLDEPNANLDSEGDAALTQALLKCRENGQTVIVMTHRPSAISAMDMLLMIKQGRQVAFGEKEKVLAEVTQQSSQKIQSRGM